MVRLPPRPTRTDILYPSQTLFRSTRSLSAVISARCGGVNTGEEGGPALIGVTCTAAARAIGANRLAPNIAAMPASARSEEHTSELQSLMRISYAVFCFKRKIQQRIININFSQHMIE